MLSVLDEDRDRAAVAYEQLRHRLTGLLRWWGAQHCEDLADRTLDRVARKLDEGAPVAKGAVGAYVRGVARMVFLEAVRESGAQRTAHSALAAVPPDEESSNGQALGCLDRALSSLKDDERRMVLRYYGEGKKEVIRRELAQEFALSATALRIRVHRLRERLEQAVTACLEQR